MLGDAEENLSPKQHPEDKVFIEVELVEVDNLLETLHNYAGKGLVIDANVYSLAFGMQCCKQIKT